MEVHYWHARKHLAPKITANPELGTASACDNALHVLLHVNRNDALSIDTTGPENAAANDNLRVLANLQWRRQVSTNVHGLLGRPYGCGGDITVEQDERVFGQSSLNVLRMDPQLDGSEDSHLRRHVVSRYRELDGVPGVF